jgi:hypothetical protein
MKITIDNYTIRLSENNSFDLYVTKQRIKKNGKTETYEMNDGYFSSISGCIKKIATNNLRDMDVTVDLKHFLDLLRHEIDRLEKIAHYGTKHA